MARTARQRAFLRAEDQRWRPAVSERVYVRRTAGNLSMIRSVGMVVATCLLPGMVEVLIVRGKQQHRGLWEVADLRPCR